MSFLERALPCGRAYRSWGRRGCPSWAMPCPMAEPIGAEPVGAVLCGGTLPYRRSYRGWLYGGPCPWPVVHPVAVPIGVLLPQGVTCPIADPIGSPQAAPPVRDLACRCSTGSPPSGICCPLWSLRELPPMGAAPSIRDLRFPMAVVPAGALVLWGAAPYRDPITSLYRALYRGGSGRCRFSSLVWR